MDRFRVSAACPRLSWTTTPPVRETEYRLAEPVTAGKAVSEVAPGRTRTVEPEPLETSTACQTVAKRLRPARPGHSGARQLHELLGMPVGEATAHLTLSRSPVVSRQVV
ncbi:hypothetical protein [Streptomyces sp. NPDC047043]|uniref:hypothetical protein n=1 Tax=Streptomyces sp. NPDC047043 TaxID=3154497 RepID=UPI0033C8CD9A